METVRAILAAHPSGISRAGVLAWAKLRIDPDFDQARLDGELAALGSEVVERDGFLWLASSAGAPAPASPARPSPDAIQPTPAPTWSPPGRPDRSAGEGIVGWRTPDGGATGWSVARPGEDETPGGELGGEPGAIPGWRGSRPRFPPAVILFLAVIGVAIVVTNVLGGALEDESPRSTAEGSRGPVDDLSVGDCIVLPIEDEFSEVQFVACDSPHEAEVFLVGDYTGSSGAFPDEAQFGTFVETGCEPAFEAYTGSAYGEQTVLTIGWFTPTQEGWEAGDRTVDCYLSPADGSSTSVSFRGANP